jgi:hypothetical protein
MHVRCSVLLSLQVHPVLGTAGSAQCAKQHPEHPTCRKLQIVID